MIENIISALEAEIESSDKFIREYDDSVVQKAYNKGMRKCLEIVQEVAKEYGKDTNVRSNADRIRVVEEFSERLLQNLNIIPVTVGESKINMVSYSALENNIKELIEQMNGD